MTDDLIRHIKAARAEGAVVLLKWDGERADKPCTVVVSHKASDYTWRKDGNDIVALTREALAEFRANSRRLA